MPDKPRGRPGEKAAPHNISDAGSGTTANLPPGAVAVRELPTWTGCPCGCRTKLPWFDDEDCVRHLPLPKAIAWPHYDVWTLGLQAHDRASCRPCQAVAS